MMKSKPEQIVYTLAARCMDCYRCLRVCPVKAIKLHRGQAYVDADRCIACGTCIRECPQGAKTFRSDVDAAERLLESGLTVAASVAPSFASAFKDWQRKRLPSALRKLGFSYVGLTASGAWHVAHESARIAGERSDRSSICTACPAVVNYVERYEPGLVDNLLPVVSPLIAHAKTVRERLGGASAVVFIGPCVAKKSEIERPGHRDVVDVALTFRELEEWMERKGVSLASCEESSFDDEPPGKSPLFPLPGGLMKTALIDGSDMSDAMLHVSGIGQVKEALSDISRRTTPCFIEPLWCGQGCINGPGMSDDRNVFERRKDVIRFAGEARRSAGDQADAREWLSTSYQQSVDFVRPGFSEDDILRVLEQTGKASPDQQLNCGACGYDTCRDKAIAVLEGMAEPEMCLPYMRRLAERRTDRIIETSPNGIVILDESLDIISMNPAFRSFFSCSDAVLGRKISYIMDPEPFEQVAAGAVERVEVIRRYESYNLVCHQFIYPLKEERQYVGIFVNITKSQDSQRQLEQIKYQTVVQAQELLDHQIAMARRIAAYLGESTAKSEELVARLMDLTGEKDETGR